MDSVADDHEPRIKIQFLVRRRRCLQIMFTNGLNFQTYQIDKSQESHPFFISNLKLSQNKRTIILHYSMERSNLLVGVKTFEIQLDGRYHLIEDNWLKDIKLFKNFYFDSEGHIKETRIHIQKKTKSMKGTFENFYVDNNDGALDLRFPSTFFMDGLLDPDNIFERLIQSEDLRLIMCGRVIVQLNSDLEEVENVGCIIHTRDNSNNIKFQFLSLKDKREEIERNLNENPEIFVQFSLKFPPISPRHQKDIMYFTYCFDEKTGDSSVVKIETTTLKCLEVY